MKKRNGSEVLMLGPLLQPREHFAACKKGETAARSGCTPASGEGGKKEGAAPEEKEPSGQTELDQRIAQAAASGSFQEKRELWKEQAEKNFATTTTQGASAVQALSDDLDSRNIPNFRVEEMAEELGKGADSLDDMFFLENGLTDLVENPPEDLLQFEIQQLTAVRDSIAASIKSAEELSERLF